MHERDPCGEGTTGEIHRSRRRGCGLWYVALNLSLADVEGEQRQKVGYYAIKGRRLRRLASLADGHVQHHTLTQPAFILLGMNGPYELSFFSPHNSDSDTVVLKIDGNPSA